MFDYLAMLENQLTSYLEGLSQDGPNEMETGDQVKAVELGIHLYSKVHELEAAGAVPFRTRGRSEAADDEIRLRHRRLANLYGLWLKAARLLAPKVERWSCDGSQMILAGTFRSSLEHAHIYRCINIDHVLEGDAQLARGEKFTMQEVRDGLRARLLAAS